MPRFSDDGEIGVLRVVGAAADECEGKECRCKPDKPGEVAARHKGKRQKTEHVEEGCDGAQRPSHAYARSGNIAHDVQVRLERTVHVVDTRREVEQHVAGEHEN